MDRRNVNKPADTADLPRSVSRNDLMAQAASS
jgi:hypothetical protein